MNSFVVIGGEGFVGHALVLELSKRYPQAALFSFDIVERHDPAKLWKFESIDLTDEQGLTAALKRAGPQVVFHTASPPAALGDINKDLMTKVNVDGTRAVIAACITASVPKLVYTSSGSVVSPAKDLINIDERTPYPEAFPDFYSETKAKGEHMVLEANGQNGLLTCAIRPVGIFGPGDRQGTPGFMAVLKNKQTSFQVGSNSNLFDWTYIDNVVHAHIIAAERLGESVPYSSLSRRLPLPKVSSINARPVPTSVKRVGGDWWPGEKQVYGIAEDADLAELQKQVDPELAVRRNRYDQFAYGNLVDEEDQAALPDSEKVTPETLTIPVAGQAYHITNGEPCYFFDIARQYWYLYNGHVPPFVLPLPEPVAMFIASLAKWYSELTGRPVSLTPQRVTYSCAHRYYNIERARRLLNYEPVVGFEEGTKRTIEAGFCICCM